MSGRAAKDETAAREMTEASFQKAEFIASYGLSKQIPTSERPEIVFSGRSNVGKSSLINKLCNRKKLAHTSGTPGKTATINFYSVDAAYFVDLPGYGYAKTSHDERRRWDELINGYFASERKICLLVQLLDCRHAPSKDDESMLDYLRHYHIPFLPVLTKADKLKPSQKAAALEMFIQNPLLKGCRDVLLTSAEKGEGMDALRAYIMESVNAF